MEAISALMALLKPRSAAKESFWFWRSLMVCIQQHSMFSVRASVSSAVLTSFSGSLVRDSISLISLITAKAISILMTNL